jgi:hypothetical protein
MLLEVHRRLGSIDAAIAAVGNVQIDEFIVSMVYQHLCVRISGNLEVCIVEILKEYTRTRANPKVMRAVERKLAGFQNPKCQKIVNLLSDFSAEWARDFEHFAEAKDIKDKIDSIAANRNLIAHGKPSGVSVGRITDFNDAHRNTIVYIQNMIFT